MTIPTMSPPLRRAVWSFKLANLPIPDSIIEDENQQTIVPEIERAPKKVRQEPSSVDRLADCRRNLFSATASQA